MKIGIVKNCVRKVVESTTNVVVANRINASGKKERIDLRHCPGTDGYYSDVATGRVYGRQGHPIGHKRKDGRVVCTVVTDDGKKKTMLRSRLVASAFLGRKLDKNEEVDHINNIVHDDRYSNLDVCDRKSNANNALTKALRKNISCKRNTSETIHIIGGAAAAARPKRSYPIEKAK